MNKENKDLLLRDLCARLPYGVKVQVFNYGIETVENLYQIDLDGYISTIEGDELKYSYKPYLFPLSSMIEEQEEEYNTMYEENRYSWKDNIIDWFHKNHFDYRGLIPLGLAIDATNLNIY